MLYGKRSSCGSWSNAASIPSTIFSLAFLLIFMSIHPARFKRAVLLPDGDIACVIDQDQLVAQRHASDRNERRVAGVLQRIAAVALLEAVLIAPAAIFVPLGELLFRRARIVLIEEGRNESDMIRRASRMEGYDVRVFHRKPSIQRRTASRSPSFA